MQPFGHKRHGPKIGGSAPLGEGELGPHLTQRGQGRGLPACQLPSFILIHPTICRQYSNVKDRQTRQTDRQRSDSIGRTVLERPFVKRFAVCYRTVVCPVCLSRPKPHCVRWGPSSPQKGHSLSPIFGPCLLCQNGRPFQLLLTTCTNGRPKIKM